MGDQYAKSGVNINTNQEIVSSIKQHIDSTYPPECLKNPIFSFGNFGGAIPVPNQVLLNVLKSTDPCEQLLLVSTMDGVGTKTDFVLKHQGTQGFKTLGYDLINHCVNDTLVGGGIPLCFLDYVASNKLDPTLVARFVEGLAAACSDNSIYLDHKITLVGGESAEMSDTYQKGKYDLVGTMIGYQYKSTLEASLLNPIIKGDLVLGFKSNSPHTNGYSLIRRATESRIFTESKVYNQDQREDLINWCCLSHKSYIDLITLLKNRKITYKKEVHITGGGWKHNPPRVLPANMKIEFNYDEYWNTMFDKDYWMMLQNITETTRDEMLEVFNCGVGLMLIISPSVYVDNKTFFEDELNSRKIGIVI